MKEKINCILCRKPIENYNPLFNLLEIDENHSVEICQNCIDKILHWQQGIFANLFPTKAAKKRLRKMS